MGYGFANFDDEVLGGQLQIYHAMARAASFVCAG